MTEKTPWIWDMTSFGYFLKVAMDSKEQVQGMYWAQGMTITAFNAVGGAFLAPLIVCHCPVPLMEETYLWMAVAAWYFTHSLPTLSRPVETMMQTVFGSALFTVLFAIFKTNQIVGGIELASYSLQHEDLVAHSRYFKVTPYAAPLLCGFLSGCGGGFLPLDTGLKQIERGSQWGVRAAFFASIVYWVATRALHFRCRDAKMWLCVVQAFGDYYPAQRDAFLSRPARLLRFALWKPTRGGADLDV